MDIGLTQTRGGSLKIHEDAYIAPMWGLPEGFAAIQMSNQRTETRHYVLTIRVTAARMTRPQVFELKIESRR